MKRLLLWLIRFYQRHISPNRPPCCRFMPTCSQYALQAVEKYGALRGGWLIVALRSCLRRKGGCGSCDGCCSACRKHCSKS